MSEPDREPKSEPKRFSASTVLIVAVVASAAAFAAGRAMHDGGVSTTGPTSAIASEPPVATTTSTMASPNALPPGHPPLDPAADPTTALGAAPAGSAESSLEWKVPAKWKVVPNASAMRLATYRIGEDAEMSVSQAGGSVEANVDRWIGQFGPDAKKTSKVTTKKVAGLDVTIVEVEGTFGGGMAMGPNANDGPKENWALLGAIVATPGMPHFFKLTGPAKTVKAARGELDELVSTLSTK